MMKKETLANFLNDRYTDKELEEILQWLEKNPFDKQRREQSYDEWKNLIPNKEFPDEKTLDEILYKIHSDINIQKAAPNEIKKIRQLFTWLTRVAAVLLLPVTLFLLYTLSERKAEDIIVTRLSIDSLEIVAPVGSQTVVQLSDGSNVHLNHGSRLKYPYTFSGNTRDVVLVGEGYFDVAHDPEKPFIVHTQHLNVKAIGTAFNIFAYPEEEVVTATLVEGKVLVEQIYENKEVNRLGAMEAGQHVECNIGTGNITSLKGDIEKYISWKDGKLIFKNENIVQVTNRLSRWYNVEFMFADDAAKKYSYTATFMDESLSQIIELLEIATPISCTVLPRKKLANGIWSKQKIIIKSKKNSQ